MYHHGECVNGEPGLPTRDSNHSHFVGYSSIGAMGSIQGPLALGQSALTQCSDGRVSVVSIREGCVEPGLVSLLHEAILGAVYLLYPIAAALEYSTYHFCKAR